MAKERVVQSFQLHRHLRRVEIPCSWCGAPVALADGDFCGVCIDCGTVMFRGPRRRVTGDELLARLQQDRVTVSAG